MDAYDHMVAWLTERPHEMWGAWCSPKSHRCGRLFAFVEPEPFDSKHTPSGLSCGCLTMIRGDCDYAAWTSALTIAIRGDERIPDDFDLITPDHLPIFAGWQRRIDQILNRTPPVWNGPPCAKPEVEMRAAPVTPPEPAR